MADISNYAEGISVSKSNIDFIGTTLSGYTSESEVIDGPDFDLVSKLVKDTKVPIIAEGRIHYPNQAKTMLIKGAYAVVVGGAITRPAEITKRFIDEMTKEK
jgi:N-acylglucosamine-6-phosphate 2-epimerase